MGAGGSTAETIDSILGLDRLTSRNPHLHLQQVATDLTDGTDAHRLTSHQYHTIYVDETKGPVQEIFRARLDALYAAGTAVNQAQIRQRIRNAARQSADNRLLLTDEALTLRSPFGILSTATLNVSTSFYIFITILLFIYCKSRRGEA